jgi:rubrerythrin
VYNINRPADTVVHVHMTYTMLFSIYNLIINDLTDKFAMRSTYHDAMIIINAAETVRSNHEQLLAQDPDDSIARITVTETKKLADNLRKALNDMLWTCSTCNNTYLCNDDEHDATCPGCGATI